MDVIVPPAFDGLFVRRAVEGNKTEAGNIRFARLDLPIATLGRGITKEGFFWMQPHGLRSTKVIGMTKDHHPCLLSVHHPADITRAGASRVNFFAVGFAV